MKNLTEEQKKKINQELLHHMPKIINIEKSEVKAQLKEKRESLLFEISTWWGGHQPGYCGTLITTDKSLYSYQESYSFSTANNENINSSNFFSKKACIDDENYSKIIEFIEKKIVPIEYEYNQIYDAGYSILVRYKNIDYCIENDIELYKEAEELIKNIKKTNFNTF